jgi:hypothetical protein
VPGSDVTTGVPLKKVITQLIRQDRVLEYRTLEKYLSIDRPSLTRSDATFFWCSMVREVRPDGIVDSRLAQLTAVPVHCLPLPLQLTSQALPNHRPGEDGGNLATCQDTKNFFEG